MTSTVGPDSHIPYLLLPPGSGPCTLLDPPCLCLANGVATTLFLKQERMPQGHDAASCVYCRTGGFTISQHLLKEPQTLRCVSSVSSFPPLDFFSALIFHPPFTLHLARTRDVHRQRRKRHPVRQDPIQSTHVHRQRQKISLELNRKLHNEMVSERFVPFTFVHASWS